MKSGSSKEVLPAELPDPAGLRAEARSLVLGQPGHLIGGQWTGRRGEDLHVVDPSTSQPLGVVDGGDASVIDAAVSAAADAYIGWYSVGPYARFLLLLDLAEEIEKRAEAFAYLDALDSGNPVRAMRRDVSNGIESLRYLAGVGLSLHGKTVPSTGGRLHYTVQEPYGVVGRIIPFNHPAMFAIGKIAAPLIAGNAVVLKPAEQTPLSALYLGEVARRVLPAGILNIVTGGAETGDALVRHREVKRIAFTGSVQTGLRIQQSAATVGVKNITLELGGKNPMVVLDDAPLEKAVSAAVTGMNLLVCQGQSCGSNSRIFVHESIINEFRKALVSRLGEIRVGVAYSDDTDMGPLVSQAQYEKVTRFLDSARQERVRFAFGGGRPESLKQEGGFFLEPTLLDAPSLDSKVAREEIFGPVICLFPWRDEAEVIGAANSVDYGLTASVWTSRIHDAHRLATLLRAGYVWVNEHGPHYHGLPFGGHKGSGVGREESVEEIESYTETKSISVNFGSRDY